MIQKFTALLIIILCGVTCNNQNSTIFLNNDYKVIYKRSSCKPNKENPQMISIPYFDNAAQVMPNCQTYPVHQTAFALFLFYHQWLKYFEDNDMAVRGVLEKVTKYKGWTASHTKMIIETKQMLRAFDL